MPGPGSESSLCSQQGPCWLMQDGTPVATLAEQPVLAGWPGCQAWLPFGTPDVCVFCSSGCLPVFPDQVHTLEIQQFLRVPTLGLHARLADGTLLHGLYSSLCHFHPPENQRTPETGTGIVVTGCAAVAPRDGSGWAPGRRYTAHFSPEKARAGELCPSPECSVALVGNLESLEGLSTAPRMMIKCPVFHAVLHHHIQCSVQTFMWCICSRYQCKPSAKPGSVLPLLLVPCSPGSGPCYFQKRNYP